MIGTKKLIQKLRDENLFKFISRRGKLSLVIKKKMDVSIRQYDWLDINKTFRVINEKKNEIFMYRKNSQIYVDIIIVSRMTFFYWKKKFKYSTNNLYTNCLFINNDISWKDFKKINLKKLFFNCKLINQKKLQNNYVIKKNIIIILSVIKMIVFSVYFMFYYSIIDNL